MIQIGGVSPSYEEDRSCAMPTDDCLRTQRKDRLSQIRLSALPIKPDDGRVNV